jgi:hypothetical protein
MSRAKSWFSRADWMNRSGHGAGRRHVFRPRVQLLEARTLLSTFTVTNNSDSATNTGSLRYAILHEPSGTTIDFAKSVTGPITLTNGVLDITTNLNIEGPGAGSLMISGQNKFEVFNVASGVTATIAGLTIAHGYYVSGGGIYNYDSLTVTDCTLSSNSVNGGFGGAIFNQGTLTVSNSKLSSNSASSSGAGGAIENLGTLSVTGSTLSSNTAGVGGGIANSDTLTVTNSTFTSNPAEYGGGIENGGKLTITGSTLSDNTANVGGGIASIGGIGNSSTLVNCTFSGNVATVAGGGIDESTGSLTLTDCTVSNNSAPDGGGINDSAAEANGTVTLGNTIVAGNMLTGSLRSGPEVDGKVVSLGFNLIGSTIGSSGWVRTDLQNQNPLLAILGNYGGPTQTMALLPGSPAIGKGSASLTGVSLPATDQRGAPRPASGVDIGAFQDQGYTLAIASGNNQATPVNHPFAKALVVVLTENFAHDPLPGATIKFKAPTSGASAKLSTSSAITNSAGQVSIAATGNFLAGSYVVTATDSADVSLTTSFKLSNEPSV